MVWVKGIKQRLLINEFKRTTSCRASLGLWCQVPPPPGRVLLTLWVCLGSCLALYEDEVGKELKVEKKEEGFSFSGENNSNWKTEGHHVGGAAGVGEKQLWALRSPERLRA